MLPTMSRFLLPVLLSTAIVATILVLGLNAGLAQALRMSVTRIGVAAAIAATCEAAVLVIFSTLIACQFQEACRQAVAARRYKCCIVSIVGVVLASVASGATLVCLSEVQGSEKEAVQFDTRGFLISFACILCLTLLIQLASIAAFFVRKTTEQTDTASSRHNSQDGFRSPEMLMRIKAIPYAKTVEAPSSVWSGAADSRPTSSNGTITSIRSSFSHVVRPITSRTRLLSVRSSRSARTLHSPTSSDLESARSPPGQNSFDSWDTSSVEMPQAALGVDTTLTPSPRFLETIPASPVTSRSSSPGTPSPPEPAKAQHPRRSKSYSHDSTHSSTRVVSQSDEAHIHPLFRSDSPAPPMATPGTMVVAAPQAGQIISERSLSRMRSSSLNGSARNLSRQGSFESFTRKNMNLSDENILVESTDEVDMAPPIPAWVLGAGSRTSLHEYQHRRLKEEIAKDEGAR